MTSEYIKKCADALVSKYGTRDPEQLVRELGIGLKYADIGSLPGLYTIVLNNRFIVINSNLDEIHKRAVAAHELGHDRLHSHLIDQVLQETMLYDMTSQPEYEANLFAALLLIEPKEAEKMRLSGASRSEIAAVFGVEEQLVELFFKVN